MELLENYALVLGLIWHVKSWDWYNYKTVLNRTFNFLQTSADREIYERILGSLSKKTKVLIGSKLEGDFFNFFNRHQDLSTKGLIKVCRHKKVIAIATSMTTLVSGLLLFG